MIFDQQIKDVGGLCVIEDALRLLHDDDDKIKDVTNDISALAYLEEKPRIQLMINVAIH